MLEKLLFSDTNISLLGTSVADCYNLKELIFPLGIYLTYSDIFSYCYTLRRVVFPKNAKNPELAHEFINFVTQYDYAYDNSSYVGYTSPNQEVMDDLSGPDGDFEGIKSYIPRSDNENDEVFAYNAETKKIISNLWSKVKIAASNAE